MEKKIGVRLLKKIDDLVNYYIEKQEVFTRLNLLLEGYISASKKLKHLIHSTKYRTKDPEHLRDKLIRQTAELLVKGKPFNFTKKNLFLKINDLAGFRIIHLHTRQVEEIDLELQKIFREEKWQIKKGPTARTWDQESERYFKEIGFKISPLPNLNMYTSVHYILQPNSSADITCEIQVRTLMEEVWGEVDHTINYPHKSKSNSCREQLKVLARVTSSCSRLVDSIFNTQKEFDLDSSPQRDRKSISGKKKISKTAKLNNGKY